MTESEFATWLSDIANELKQGKGTIALVHLNESHCQIAACGDAVEEAMLTLMATAAAMQQTDIDRVLN